MIKPIINPITTSIGLAQALLDWPNYEIVVIGNDGAVFQPKGLTYSSFDNILIISSQDNQLDTLEKVKLAKEYLANEDKSE